MHPMPTPARALIAMAGLALLATAPGCVAVVRDPHPTYRPAPPPPPPHPPVGDRDDDRYDRDRDDRDGRDYDRDDRDERDRDDRVDISGDVAFFYDDLRPFGRWVRVGAYGTVWVPRVAVGWRPYTTGRWVYTDDGWMWVAEEEWGWAPFHYGRWYEDARWGWVWVPARVWAPAWVVWRGGGGHVGWAPMPPRAAVSVRVDIAPQHWCFVEERHMAEPVHRHVLPRERNVTIINVTNNIERVDVREVERVTHREFRPVRVVEAGSPREHRRADAVSDRDQDVRVYRPRPDAKRGEARVDRRNDANVERRDDRRDDRRDVRQDDRRDDRRDARQDDRRDDKRDDTKAAQRDDRRDDTKAVQRDDKRDEKRDDKPKPKRAERKKHVKDTDKEKEKDGDKPKEDKP